MFSKGIKSTSGMKWVKLIKLKAFCISSQERNREKNAFLKNNNETWTKYLKFSQGDIKFIKYRL